MYSKIHCSVLKKGLEKPNFSLKENVFLSEGNLIFLRTKHGFLSDKILALPIAVEMSLWGKV